MAEHSVEFRIDFTYLHEKKKALHDAEGEIQKGQCIRLCGESGCGKSTLLRCINHLIPEFYEGELTGFIRLAGEEIQELSIADVSTKAASASDRYRCPVSVRRRTAGAVRRI